MKKKYKHTALLLCAGLMLAFLGLIAAVKLVDVRAIGPQNSAIGLAGLNGWFRDVLGQQNIWYDISEVLGLLAIGLAGCLGLLGLRQWIRQKSLRKVDGDILLLGGFYVLVLACYVLFEICIVNYRPVLVEGVLEASFPSSHTVLSVCVLGSAIWQAHRRISHPLPRRLAVAVCSALMAVIVVGRLLSGVHWFTDILGGLLLSGSLIAGYIGLCCRIRQQITA